jgi:hypothetical protein
MAAALLLDEEPEAIAALIEPLIFSPARFDRGAN